MAGSANDGFKIKIAAIDNTTAVLTKVNKQLALLAKPFGDLGKQVGKLGDTTGLNRLAGGMRNLAAGSLDTFRSLDRIVPQIGALTSAASIAGIAALATSFGNMGVQLRTSSQMLGVGAGKMTALQSAARQTGASAEVMTSTLSGLDQQLRAATFRGEGQQKFNQLGISFGQVGVKARGAGEAIYDIFDAVKKYNDAGDRTQAERVMENFGIPSDLWNLAIKGRDGVKQLEENGRRLGTVLSDADAKSAAGLGDSLNLMKEAGLGLAMSIEKSVAPQVSQLADTFARWAMANKDVIGTDVAGWVTKVTTAVSGLNKWEWGAIIGTAIGYQVGGFKGAAAGLVAGLAAGGAATASESYISSPDKAGRKIYDPFNLFNTADTGAAQDIQTPRAMSNAAAVAARSHAFWMNYFNGNALAAAGMETQENAESTFDPSKWNKDHTSFGLFQYTGDRLKKLQAMYGMNPTEDQQRAFAAMELNTTEGEARRRLLDARTSGGAGMAGTYFERPKFFDQRASERAVGAQRQFAYDKEMGKVGVEVTFRNAPAGMSARTTASGGATVAPPRVGSAMPDVATAVPGY